MEAESRDVCTSWSVEEDLPLTKQAFKDLMTIMNLEDFETRQLQPLTARSIIAALTVSDDEDISAEVREQRQFALGNHTPRGAAL
eukprot:COSAG01_NODE_29739_length_630_cov_2.702448_2_plen_85_part_00